MRKHMLFMAGTLAVTAAMAQPDLLAAAGEVFYGHQHGCCIEPVLSASRNWNTPIILPTP